MCVSVSCEMNPKVIDACGEEIMVEGRRFHANSERNTKGLGRHLVRVSNSIRVHSCFFLLTFALPFRSDRVNLCFLISSGLRVGSICLKVLPLSQKNVIFVFVRSHSLNFD